MSADYDDDVDAAGDCDDCNYCNADRTLWLVGFDVFGGSVKLIVDFVALNINMMAAMVLLYFCVFLHNLAFNHALFSSETEYLFWV